MTRPQILTALIAAAALWVAADARSAPTPTGPLLTQIVENTAQCFVDNATERKWCERRSEVARLVDCVGTDSKLKCRIEHMNAMGEAGWRLVRTGGGSFSEWYDAPLFFYERVTLRQTEGG